MNLNDVNSVYEGIKTSLDQPPPEVDAELLLRYQWHRAGEVWSSILHEEM